MTEYPSITAKARKLSAADWVGPAPADDWERLPFGEQHRYVLQALRQNGVVPIPDDLTESERTYLNREVTKATENAIGWIIHYREFFNGKPQP